MANFKKVETIYQDGKPDGNRVIHINLSPITAYVIPRPLLPHAKKLKGINNPGIYFLINENDINGISQIYVGQTRNGVARLFDHNRAKDFWNKAIMFLSDANTCTLDMISWLERYAINKAKESKRYEVMNYDEPKIIISDYDLADVEKIYSDIQFIIGSLGYKMDSTAETTEHKEIFSTSRNNTIAYGVYDGDKFQVLENSKVDLSRNCNTQKYNLQREELLANGDIVKIGDDYVLQVTLEFNTPSGASEFVIGCSTNGWTEWKNDKGETLDKVYRNTK